MRRVPGYPSTGRQNPAGSSGSSIPLRSSSPSRRHHESVVNGSHLGGGSGEHTVMGASHKATLRQYPLLNLCFMRATSNVVVVGHGMVGHRFVEALRSRDADCTWRVTVLAEEADAAYDRVGFTGYTEHWDRGLLALPGNDYAGD